MNGYFIRGLLLGRSVCVVLCSGILQFLTRPHLWVLAALVFFSFSGARAADNVPADSHPAQYCKWGYFPGGGAYTVDDATCDPSAWRDLAISSTNSSTRYNIIKVVIPEYDDTANNTYFDIVVVESYCNGGICSNNWVRQRLFPMRREIVNLYFCPPLGLPDYDYGPLEKEDGSKWCAKEPGEPEQTPEEKCANYKDTIEPSNQYFFLESSTCVSGCEIKPFGDGIVYMPVMLSDGDVWNFTTGLGAFTGAVCPLGGDGGEGEVPEPPGPVTEAKPTEEKTDCQPVYNASTGVSSCTATSTKDDPGKYKCGHVNGVWTCVKVGEQKTTETAEKQSQTTTNPDGSATTTDTVKTTTTTCKGDDCVTTTKTTTTTTNKDAQGNTTGTSDKCEGDGCGSSGVGGGGDGDGYPGAGDWYEKTEKTWETVLTDFKNRVSAAPFAQSYQGFLTVSASGSCPIWSTDIPIFGSIVIDMQCSSVMEQIWPIISAVLLAVAAFFSFRIAFM